MITTHILDIPGDESRQILAELYAHSAKPEFIYRHPWQPHDMVFWDNRALIHLAAKAGVRPSIADPRAYVQVNIDGTLHLLELAAQHRVQHIVFASSSSVGTMRSSRPALTRVMRLATGKSMAPKRGRGAPATSAQ